jgi:pimeloyl-ACP methyl ester carboxylesterase
LPAAPGGQTSQVRKAFTGWEDHEFTAAGGTRMHAAAYGPVDAPTVVGVHGLGCSHRYFWPFAESLAPKARLVVPDLPGFGRSRSNGRVLDVRGQSTALAEWLAATGRAGSVLVGNSTGCQVAVDLAYAFPELAGPLVLNSPTFDRHARRPLVQVGRLLRDGVRERPTLGLVLGVDYLQAGPRRGLRTFRLMLPDPIEEKASHVTRPVVVAVGDKDPIIPRAWAQELTDRFPHGRLVMVPGAPHTLNYSAPEALARITAEVLDAPA